MSSRLIKWVVLAVTVSFVVFTPVSQAQAPSAVSIFSIWVRLSLRGFSQQEIESLLRNMDEKAVEEVKERLRRSVMANLQLKNIGELLAKSRDKDDLHNVISSVQTEIRFAGMQNDHLLKLRIKDRYGLSIDLF